MKKIISLLASLAMVASASISAFAAIPADAVAPKGAVVLADTGERDSGYGIYTLTVDLSDLGTLTHTKNLTKYSGTKIVQFNFNVNGESLMFADATGNLYPSAYGNSGDSSQFTGIYASFVSASARYGYPYDGSGKTSTTSCDDAFVLTFYGVPGNTITLSNPKIGYTTFVDNTAVGTTDYLIPTFDQTTFKLPGGTEELALDVTQQGQKNGHGYIWKADVTKGADDLTSFTADFTTANESTHRQIRNFSEFANKFSGGKLTFHIGLKTTKELTGASFTISDAKGSVTATGTVN